MVAGDWQRFPSEDLTPRANLLWEYGGRWGVGEGGADERGAPDHERDQCCHFLLLRPTPSQGSAQGLGPSQHRDIAGLMVRSASESRSRPLRSSALFSKSPRESPFYSRVAASFSGSPSRYPTMSHTQLSVLGLSISTASSPKSARSHRSPKSSTSSSYEDSSASDSDAPAAYHTNLPNLVPTLRLPQPLTGMSRLRAAAQRNWVGHLDVLGVLAKVVMRPHPVINLGPIGEATFA